MRWHSLQGPGGFDKRNKRRSGGTLGEGGTMREMAAASLHDDRLLDSEKFHERASCAHDDSLVGNSVSVRGCKMATQVSCCVGCHR